MISTIPTSKRQVCAFTLGDHLFGIDISYVQEVLRFQECTPVPLTPPLVSGLLNLRGQLVLAIDLRERLGLGTQNHEKSRTNIVTRIGNGILGFVVDELFDIMSLDNEHFAQTPGTMSQDEKQFVTGCFKLNKRLLIMLDAVQLADISATLRANLRDNHIQREQGTSLCIGQ